MMISPALAARTAARDTVQRKIDAYHACHYAYRNHVASKMHPNEDIRNYLGRQARIAGRRRIVAALNYDKTI